MTNNIFNIDFDRLVIWNLATFLRRTVRVIWLLVITSPLLRTYNQLLDFRAQSLYKMAHNSQIVYLQKVLNDKFDNTNRGIEVRNSDILEPVWHYDAQEQKPVYYYDTADEHPVYFRSQADFNRLNSDFEVVMPLALKPGTQQEVDALELQVRLLVDYYKLYSKKYIIKYE